MSQPRPRPQPQPDMAALLARIEALSEELARLKAGGNGLPSADEWRQALARQSASEAKIAELTAALQQVQQTSTPQQSPQTDTTALEARLAAVEEQSARTSGAAPTQADMAQLAQRQAATEQRQAAIEQRLTAEPQQPAHADRGTDPAVLARLDELENHQAQHSATAITAEDLRLTGERLSAVENEQRKATAAATVDGEARRQLSAAVTDLKAELANTTASIPNLAAVQQDVRAVAADVADIKSSIAAQPIAAAVGKQTDAGQQSTIDYLYGLVKGDPTLATALTRNGLTIASDAITSLAASKLTGDVATAQLTTNIVAAVNGSAGGVSAAKVSTGDLPAAQMQTNIVTAANNSAGGFNAAKVTTGALGGSVTIGGNQLTGDLVLGAGQKAGFYGATAPAQQTAAALTNSVTSGGTSDTVADYSIVDYSTDSATIRNNQYQLARKLAQVVTALRTYGLLG